MVGAAVVCSGDGSHYNPNSFLVKHYNPNSIGDKNCHIPTISLLFEGLLTKN